MSPGLARHSPWGLRTRLLALALLAAAALVRAQAQTPAPSAPGSAFMAALQQVRLQGCDGRPGVDAPLAFEPRLARAAERASRGTELTAAMSAEGYRVQRARMFSLQGYSGAKALAQGLARHACEALLDPAWRQVGLHQRGPAGWIILADPFSPPQPQDEAQIRSELHTRINQARAQARRCGEQWFPSAAPLQLQARLHRVAQDHANDMATHHYFSHTGRDGSQVGERARRAGYEWRTVGENLAAGQPTAEGAVQGWLDSPGHCANLMRASFTEMGLAFAVNLGSPSGIYWVQVLAAPR